jgi:hypothetical protein
MRARATAAASPAIPPPIITIFDPMPYDLPPGTASAIR